MVGHYTSDYLGEGKTAPEKHWWNRRKPAPTDFELLWNSTQSDFRPCPPSQLPQRCILVWMLHSWWHLSCTNHTDALFESYASHIMFTIQKSNWWVRTVSFSINHAHYACHSWKLDQNYFVILQRITIITLCVKVGKLMLRALPELFWHRNRIPIWIENTPQRRPLLHKVNVIFPMLPN